MVPDQFLYYFGMHKLFDIENIVKNRFLIGHNCSRDFFNCFPGGGSDISMIRYYVVVVETALEVKVTCMGEEDV